MVRVWYADDRAVQHFTDDPGDDTARSWTGTTVCGLEGHLTWVHAEHVDSGTVCEPCFAQTGTTSPPMTGQSMSPP